MSKKTEILEAATFLFANKGFKETTMSEVASMTGTAGSNIFYHYKTKEDIFLAILKNTKDELLFEFETYLRQNRFTNGLEMLESTIAFYLNLAGARRELFMLLHHRFPYELAAVNPTCREHLEAIYTCFVDLFEKAIQLGQEDGSIVQASARKSALLIFAMVDGVVRFNTYNLYEAGALYEELMGSCRRMLQANPGDKNRSATC
jgi:AcrR family transcriptional regulator